MTSSTQVLMAMKGTSAAIRERIVDKVYTMRG